MAAKAMSKSHAERLKRYEEARNRDIVSVAESLGMNLGGRGNDLYWDQHDSLKINRKKNYFYWNSRQKGGGPIELVQMIKECRPKEAVNFLLDPEYEIGEVAEYKEELKNFRYFLNDHKNMNLTKNYLINQRKLDEATVDHYISMGLLAQTTYKDPDDGKTEPVMVFKSRDRDNNISSVSLRGLWKQDKHDGNGYLRRVLGDGFTGMVQKVGNPPEGAEISKERPLKIITFEAPIDLMSYYEMHQNEIGDALLLAMDGFKKGTISKLLANQLNLNITEDEKVNYIDILSKTMKKNDLIQLVLAVDNDSAGKEFIDTIGDVPFSVTTDLPPLREGDTKSDWNQVLVERKEEKKEVNKKPTSKNDTDNDKESVEPQVQTLVEPTTNDDHMSLEQSMQIQDDEVNEQNNTKVENDTAEPENRSKSLSEDVFIKISHKENGSAITIYTDQEQPEKSAEAVYEFDLRGTLTNTNAWNTGDKPDYADVIHYDLIQGDSLNVKYLSSFFEEWNKYKRESNLAKGLPENNRLTSLQVTEEYSSIQEKLPLGKITISSMVQQQSEAFLSDITNLTPLQLDYIEASLQLEIVNTEVIEQNKKLNQLSQSIDTEEKQLELADLKANVEEVEQERDKQLESHQEIKSLLTEGGKIACEELLNRKMPDSTISAIRSEIFQQHYPVSRNRITNVMQRLNIHRKKAIDLLAKERLNLDYPNTSEVKQLLCALLHNEKESLRKGKNSTVPQEESVKITDSNPITEEIKEFPQTVKDSLEETFQEIEKQDGPTQKYLTEQEIKDILSEHLKAVQKLITDQEQVVENQPANLPEAQQQANDFVQDLQKENTNFKGKLAQAWTMKKNDIIYNVTDHVDNLRLFVKNNFNKPFLKLSQMLSKLANKMDTKFALEEKVIRSHPNDKLQVPAIEEPPADPITNGTMNYGNLLAQLANLNQDEKVFISELVNLESLSKEVKQLEAAISAEKVPRKKARIEVNLKEIKEKINSANENINSLEGKFTLNEAKTCRDLMKSEPSYEALGKFYKTYYDIPEVEVVVAMNKNKCNKDDAINILAERYFKRNGFSTMHNLLSDSEKFQDKISETMKVVGSAVNMDESNIIKKEYTIIQTTDTDGNPLTADIEVNDFYTQDKKEKNKSTEAKPKNKFEERVAKAKSAAKSGKEQNNHEKNQGQPQLEVLQAARRM